MRVAFTLFGNSNWIGGYNYLLNLVRLLGQHQKGRLVPVVFVVGDHAEEDIAPFTAIDGVELVRAPGRRARRLVSMAQALLWGRDLRMQRLFVQHRIDLVFEVAQFFGWRLGIPTIAWMTDFQHRALPHMFSRAARWKRELGFRAQVAGGRFIMVSSDDARQLCERHYPATRGRARTVHFAVPPGEDIPFSHARAIADSYGLPDEFFFMPNQFWKHKNHALVIEALAILRERGHSVVVASTGKQADSRDPGHFPRLRARLDELQLNDAFRLLGLVPHEHMAPLLRASSALLNPSLYEGWSTTVEEARTFGTPMVLSDLDVHREQAGEDAAYFDRQSAASLADALQNFRPLTDARRVIKAIEARAAAEMRCREFAGDFAALVESCLRPTGRP